jgi:aerotaxis receptor
MKLNLPVTGVDFEYDASQMLVSMTDLKGRIVHANDAFIAVSGFTREEIMGKAHNIVRHPDMPPEAFADLWQTLQAGLPWTALVKNRRKNGDHYWVRANVTPVMSGATVTGYLSVRVKPSREDVAAAEALYRDMRDGKKLNVRIVNGQLVHTGLRGLVDAYVRRGLSARIASAVGLGALLPVATAIAGLSPWIVATTAVVSAATVAGYLIATISVPMREVRDTVRRLAAADLAVTLNNGRYDELGQIAQGLTQTAVNLMAVVQDVSSGVQVLTTATSEIALGNTDLSRRTETQAANLEETAASMEELNSTVKNSAETARHAAQLAGTATTSAAKGGEMMKQMVATMDEISSSSSRIETIISVIDGIAFQTNLLALNAAVEAARAGTQGRGFAVVAAEVRNLAQRSAEAAREIKGLIGASVGKVEAGSHLVREAGKSIGEIVTQVGNVARLIEDISNATGEQTLGISQVNDAVGQLDQVTQQNAALVEEAAAAAESLNDQAARLAEAVSVFSLGAGHEAQRTIQRAQATSRADGSLAAKSRAVTEWADSINPDVEQSIHP